MWISLSGCVILLSILSVTQLTLIGKPEQKYKTKLHRYNVTLNMHTPNKFNLLRTPEVIAPVPKYNRKKFRKLNASTDSNNILSIRSPEVTLLVPKYQRKKSRKFSNASIDSNNIFTQKCSTMRNAIKQAQIKLNCIPRDVIVDIISPTGDVIYPPQALIKRCDGICSKTKICSAAETRDVNLPVRIKRNNKLTCAYVVIQEDTKCRCGCPKGSNECTPQQKFLKEECRCICTNMDEEKKCYSKSSTHEWDSKSCSCVCRAKECTTGTQWSPGLCRCIKG